MEPPFSPVPPRVVRLIRDIGLAVCAMPLSPDAERRPRWEWGTAAEAAATWCVWVGSPEASGARASGFHASPRGAMLEALRRLAPRGRELHVDVAALRRQVVVAWRPAAGEESGP